MKRQNLLNVIDSLSEEIKLDDLFEKLVIAEEIEKGLEQIEKGATVHHNLVVEHFNTKWGR